MEFGLLGFCDTMEVVGANKKSVQRALPLTDPSYRSALLSGN